jgi:hypothetical protein
LVPRWLAHLFVVVGWLLTPGLAWGAAYVGLWATARFALRLGSPLAMLGTAAAGAALASLAVLFAWVRFMRRLPHWLSHHMARRRSEAHRVFPTGD